MRRIGKGLLAVILGWMVLGPSLFIVKSKAMSPSTRPATNNGANEYQSSVVASLDGPITLSGGSARLTLEQPIAEKQRTLAARLTALSPDRHLYLILKDLHVKEQPGILYSLYVDLPADAKPVRDDPHYVGVLNFFNAQVSGEVRPPNTGSSIFFSRDITALLRNLQTHSLLCDETTVTIIPSGTPAADSEARIGRIEIVEQ